MPVIETKNLTKSFGGKTVLSDFNISVNQGEVFGLLGSNGAGKTTAIDCILGTKKPDGGTVRILGLNPKTERKNFLKMWVCNFKNCIIRIKLQYRSYAK